MGLLVCATGASAQFRFSDSSPRSIESAEVDVAGKCDLERYGVKSDGFGYLAYTFVVDPDPALMRNSSPTGGGPVQRKPQPLERVNLLGASSDYSKLFVQFESPVTCGWIARSALLIPRRVKANENPLDALMNGPDALRMFEFSTEKRMQGNELSAKAVLHNAKGGGTLDVPVYADLGTRRLRNEKLFSILDVYDKRSGKDAETGRTIDYYLLGGSDRGSAASLAGWVRSADAYIWPSRMAVYWAGTKQGAAYTNENMTGPADILESGEEPPERNVRRFPVISQLPPPEELWSDPSFRTAKPEERKARIKQLEIIFPAEACRVDAGTGGKDCIDAGELERRRRVLDDRIRRYKNVDIMFLVDGTESMEPYLRATASAVAELARRPPPKTRELRLKLGAFAYGDYRTNQAQLDNVAFMQVVAPLDPTELADGGMGALNDVAAIRKQIGSDPHSDALEAPFAALIRTAKYPRLWRPEAATRIIIHIADHGNRLAGRTSRDSMQGEASGSSPLVETVTTDDVVRELAAIGVEYIPVNVLSRVDQGREPIANKMFQEQAQEIFTKLIARRKQGALAQNLRNAIVFSTYDRNNLTETEAARSARIGDALRRAFDLALAGPAQVNAEIICSSEPDSEGCARSKAMLSQFEPIVTTIIEARRAANDLDTKDIAGRQQVVRRGFAPLLLPDKREQFTYWMALDPGQLNQLTALFRRLCQEFEYRGSRESLVRELVGENVKDVAGEMKLTLSQALEKRYSIPSNLESEHLALSLGEFTKKAKHEKGVPEVWRSLCKSNELFTGIGRTGWRVNPSSMTCTGPKEGCDGSRGDRCVTCEVPPAGRTRYLWEWSDSSVIIFYVPVNYLP
jgi:hypothetical protein